MVSNITLTSSMRSNLNALKNIQGMMSRTQTVLSTGKKVNSAIDNATSYYQARSLTNRAADLNALLDSMGQGIQTVQAATTGLEKGLDFMEQASAIAMEAAEKANISFGTIQDIQGYIDDGYTAITSSMTTAEIQALLTDSAKVVLADDITLTAGLDFSADNITFDGNGHTISYTGTQGFDTINNSIVASDSAIKVTGRDTHISNMRIAYTNAMEQGSAVTIDGGKASIDNIAIDASTTAGRERIYGIQVIHDGELELDSTKHISVAGKYSHKIVNGNPDLWDGQYNTDMIVQQIGEDGLSAWACSQYYTAGTQAGDWYLPGLGELLDMYGTDYSQMTSPADGCTDVGAVGDNRETIKGTLTFLQDHGADAKDLAAHNHGASTENTGCGFFWMNAVSGTRGTARHDSRGGVRAFLNVENIDATNAAIGDILYSDKTYGKADETSYAEAVSSGKTAIGVVTNISEDKTSLKVVSLRALAATSGDSSATFDPEHPYDGYPGMVYSKLGYRDEQDKFYGVDIVNVKDYDRTGSNGIPSIYSALTAGGTITVTNENVAIKNMNLGADVAQFNGVMSQYDTLIQDSSYQGINLLNNGTLNVTFNETRTSNYSISGIDASASGLGVNSATWQSVEDIQASINQVLSAVNKMRGFQSELGTSYQIIQTRQNFTDGMIDILETGADDLVLADMNEESAQYLMLQTRQQLAINSLSLASQSAQSVLKLF